MKKGPMMKTRMIVRYLAFAAIAFLGGVAAQMITTVASVADAGPKAPAPEKLEAQSLDARIITAETVNLRDSKGRVRLMLSTSGDVPTIGLYDGKGHCRLMAGVDLRVLKEWMGHASIQTTMIYSAIKPTTGAHLIDRI